MSPRELARVVAVSLLLVATEAQFVGFLTRVGKVCSWDNWQVSYNGKCEQLLAQGPCRANHRLVLTSSGTPYCSERRCPLEQEYWEARGECFFPQSGGTCKGEEWLSVDRTGHTACSCREQYLADPATGDCVAEKEQGPCQHSYYVEFDQDQMTCVPNPCITDKMIMYQGLCYKRNYAGYCPEDRTPLHLNADQTISCGDPNAGVFFPPSPTCPRGTKRLYGNKCRAVENSVPWLSNAPARSQCRGGYSRIGGICTQTLNLPG